MVGCIFNLFYHFRIQWPGIVFSPANFFHGGTLAWSHWVQVKWASCAKSAWSWTSSPVIKDWKRPYWKNHWRIVVPTTLGDITGRFKKRRLYSFRGKKKSKSSLKSLDVVLSPFSKLKQIPSAFGSCQFDQNYLNLKEFWRPFWQDY